MAKTSKKIRCARPQKYKVREYTRCERCGRPHSVYRKFKLCRLCFRELAYKGQIVQNTFQLLMLKISLQALKLTGGKKLLSITYG